MSELFERKEGFMPLHEAKGTVGTDSGEVIEVSSCVVSGALIFKVKGESHYWVLKTQTAIDAFVEQVYSKL